jgi:DHA2 family multidrug resistance protein
MEEIQDTNPGYKWTVLPVVMAGAFVSTLNASVINVSLPSIMADFGINLDDAEWISIAYMLAFATLMPLTVWLRARMGYKNIFVCALAVFTAGSLLCGFSWNITSMITGRVIQALGGGAMSPTAMAMIGEVFPAKDRGKATGIYGAGIMLGPAIGPTLGGYLTDYFGWRSVFFINIPVGVIAVLAAMELLINDKPKSAGKSPFDFWGFGFLTAFMVAALYGFSRGQKDGWISPFIVGCFILAALCFIGFILVDTYIENPIIDVSLFKIPVFSSAIAVTLVRSIGQYGVSFLIPVFVQQRVGYSALQSGLLMLPASIIMAIAFPLIGFISDRVGPKILSFAGVTIMASSIYIFKDVSENTSAWGFIYPMMIIYIGMSMLTTPILTTLMNVVPVKKIGVASSMNSIIMQAGASVGIALFTTILADRSIFHLSIVGAGFNAGNPAFTGAVGGLIQRMHGLGYGMAASVAAARSELLKAVTSAAVVRGFQDTFLISSMVIAVAIPITLILPMHPVHKMKKTGGEILDIEEPVLEEAVKEI